MREWKDGWINKTNADLKRKQSLHNPAEVCLLYWRRKRLESSIKKLEAKESSKRGDVSPPIPVPDLISVQQQAAVYDVIRSQS